MADKEEYFPRGGKKPVYQFNTNANFLSTIKKGEKRKKYSKKKSEDDDGYSTDEGPDQNNVIEKSNNVIGISCQTIKQGVLILGRVHKVFETKCDIMLPCRISGHVMACHISEPYNKLLESYVNDKIDNVKDLSSMFRAGQYLALKVLETTDNRVALSAMPQHVNASLTHSDLVAGAIVQAAVSTIEDHGFVMDVGISHCTAFLAEKNANPEIDLDVGMVTWCCVKSTTPRTDGSVVTLTNQLEALRAAVRRRVSNTACLLPGTAVNFVVDQPLNNGIEGHISDDIKCYVQRQHADTVKGKKPGMGQKVRGRVLYVMPIKNAPYLTMKNIFESTYPDLEKEQKLKEGDIIDDAQVIKIAGRSVHFKLGDKGFGLMSLKKIYVDENLTDEEVVANSYPPGSKHKVRVLCYHMSDYLYSVSDRPEVLQQMYFTIEQMEIGQIVRATVKSLAESHVILQVGRVTGVVPHIHLYDAGVCEEQKKNNALRRNKFKVGQEVQARVIEVIPSKPTLVLTLKPSLMSPDLEILKSYEEAVVGKAYTAVIKYIRDYLLVAFFKNVVAYIPAQHVSSTPISNLQDAFHLGQIVTCTILKVDVENSKILGSLTKDPFCNKNRDINNKTSLREKTNSESDVKKRKKTKSISEEQTENNEDTAEDDKPKKKKKKREEESSNAVNEKSNVKTSKQNEVFNCESDTEMEELKEESTNKEHKKKKRKKRKIDEDSDLNTECIETKFSEESDAIETDINEQSDDVLTSQDIGLMDLSDCVTLQKCKKRVSSLRKSIKARLRRIHRIKMKISNIEEIGLTARNKKFHSAMHAEIIVIKSRIKKLRDALNEAEDKRNEMQLKNSDIPKKDITDKTKKSKTGDREKRKGENKDIVEKLKKIKVVESLQPALDLPSAKEFWTSNLEDEPKDAKKMDESSSSDEEAKEPTKKKRKKLTAAEKVAKAREEEEKLRQLEVKAAESEHEPRSSDQFERALLANPNCSQLWIAYMAFHLQSTEIDRARAVGRKALNTITFREEGEKLNVWLALLNLEHRFGTKESQQKTMEDALQMNEPYLVHSKLLDIYVDTSKPQELSALCDLMMRKYRQSPDAFKVCGEACYKLGLVDKARQIMQKAITVLDKKHHVDVLVKFAVLERGAGQVERAEAVFEQVLAAYPHRVDVASVYLDCLLKTGDQTRIREVIDRLTTQQLPARKMKTLFKKCIEIEERFGDSERVAKLREKAMEYIEKAKY